MHGACMGQMRATVYKSGRALRRVFTWDVLAVAQKRLERLQGQGLEVEVLCLVRVALPLRLFVTALVQLITKHALCMFRAHGVGVWRGRCAVMPVGRGLLYLWKDVGDGLLH